MSAPARRLLWLVIGGGTAAQIVLAFATGGHAFDIESIRLVASGLDDHGFDLYGAVNPDEELGGLPIFRWPYPPGFFPLAAAGVGIADGTGLPFDAVIQLFPIAATAAIAWLVQDFLGRRGASERARVVAAALVVLGPSFIAVAGYHGQIDPVAILPAVAAVRLWETGDSQRRALWAGLLIGLGASVKTVPAIMVLALLPSARNPREAVTLVVTAAAVPLALLAPFLLSDGSNVLRALRYTGGPGLGGLSMLVEPDLVRAFLTNAYPTDLTTGTETLYDNASVVVLVGLALTGAFLLRFRPGATEAAAFLWVAVYVFMPNWFPQYMVWGLPFLIMAGHLAKVAIVQGALVPVLLLFYLRPWGEDGVAIWHFLIMLGLWVGWVAAVFVLGRRISRAPRARTTPVPGTP